MKIPFSNQNITSSIINENAKFLKNFQQNLSLNSSDTGSLELEIDLQQLLSLSGLNLPDKAFTTNSSSFSENFPSGSDYKSVFNQKIKLIPISGSIVNELTNGPISGVIVTNKLLQKAITNQKGEFVIRHPNIKNTGLNASLFPISIVKPKFSPEKIIPYTSTKDLKIDLGILTLTPFQSNLEKEIKEILKYPEPVVEDYVTQNVTLDFKMQKKLNLSIDNLKSIAIPLILFLISTYGIGKVKEFAEKYKKNPAEAFEELKYLIECPPGSEISKLISTKNDLVKSINDAFTTIDQVTQLLNSSQQVLNVANPLIKTLRKLPTPTAINGVGIPISAINVIRDTLKYLDKVISKATYVTTATTAILNLFKATLGQVLDLLLFLDALTQYCYPDTEQSKIEGELTKLTTYESTQLSPVVINVNGFTMGVETETTDKPLKRRRATATNKQGVVMLVGEWSFSSIDQILIDELVFYIQQNNLKAD